VICSTPIMSSGASWLPSIDAQGKPSDLAKLSTMDDFPIPGAPQIKAGRVMAALSSTSFRAWLLRSLEVIDGLNGFYDLRRVCDIRDNFLHRFIGKWRFVNSGLIYRAGENPFHGCFEL